ncbi:hypothetical protein AYO40_01770 [Planctomycetaceae bacterium SCGC AG-212-D15]|nr:hypothetical protein AYO40_01770 [Planctomycetaceae bacterium SCGC AG-212-D15]
MFLPNLTIAAAKYALGILPSSEIPRIADDALNRGVYTDAFARLYDVRNPIMSDVGPVFELALKELAVDVPTQEYAFYVLLRPYIRAIIEGVVTPYEGLRTMTQDIYHDGGLYRRAKEYVGDSHGIQHLLGMRWGYDDIRERPDEVSFAGKFGEGAIAALDDAVIEEAITWHRKNAGIAIVPAWLTSTVLRISQSIVGERSFDRLPVVADALEDAGCTHMELLGHLREQGSVHVRGCWAVDLLLGKE